MRGFQTRRVDVSVWPLFGSSVGRRWLREHTNKNDLRRRLWHQRRARLKKEKMTRLSKTSSPYAGCVRKVRLFRILTVWRHYVCVCEDRSGSDVGNCFFNVEGFWGKGLVVSSRYIGVFERLNWLGLIICIVVFDLYKVIKSKSCYYNFPKNQILNKILKRFLRYKEFLKGWVLFNEFYLTSQQTEF